MGATNKCLARITKSPRGSNTTIKINETGIVTRAEGDVRGDSAGKENRLAGRGGAKGRFTTLIASATARAGRSGTRAALHEKLSYRGHACARCGVPGWAVYSGPVTNAARLRAAPVPAE